MEFTIKNEQNIKKEKNQNEIKKELKCWQRILNALPEGIILFNMKNEILYSNTSILELFDEFEIEKAIE